MSFSINVGKIKMPPSPEWLLQAAMIAEFHKLEASGMALSAVGDMNAGKRSRWSATQAKAMGMTAGEPDIRVYGYPARVLLIEVKTTKGKLSAKQIARHDRLAELGHTVLVVAPTDEDNARHLARYTQRYRVCDRGWL